MVFLTIITTPKPGFISTITATDVLFKFGNIVKYYFKYFVFIAPRFGVTRLAFPQASSLMELKTFKIISVEKQLGGGVVESNLETKIKKYVKVSCANNKGNDDDVAIL